MDGIRFAAAGRRFVPGFTGVRMSRGCFEPRELLRNATVALMLFVSHSDRGTLNHALAAKKITWLLVNIDAPLLTY